MADDGSETQPPRIPFFIRKQLENLPILPGENARDFKTLFYQVEYSAEGGQKTAADFFIDFQATVLTWNLQRTERMITAVIRHHRLEAVAALIRRTSTLGGMEPGSLAYRAAHGDALDYFTSEDAKKKYQELFAKAGFGPDAIEVEAFEQALPQITILNRQQAAARRDLLAFLKEIDRRNARRGRELRKMADKMISRSRASTTEKGAAS